MKIRVTFNYQIPPSNDPLDTARILFIDELKKSKNLPGEFTIEEVEYTE